MTMNPVHVKICCIASVEEAHLAVGHGASAVGLVGESFFNEQRRKTYVTPTSYLELLNLYAAMLSEQRVIVARKISHYSAGVNKLVETNKVVDKMKKAREEHHKEQELKRKAEMLAGEGQGGGCGAAAVKRQQVRSDKKAGSAPLATPGITLEQLKQVFDVMDSNGDGHVNRAEMVNALRKEDHHHVRSLLGLPPVFREGSSDDSAFESVFEQLDGDDSREISWPEFLAAFATQGGDDPAVKTLDLSLIHISEPTRPY